MQIREEVTLVKNVICFHQLFCQTLLTCPNGAKTLKICIKVQNMHKNVKMHIGEEVTLVKNFICFHQLFCQTLLTCPNGAKTTKICIKVQNYA